MKYVCQICGYVYDEEKENALFNSLPEDWKCPLCGAPKSAFVPEQNVGAIQETDEEEINPDDLKKLSNGQLAAIFSNLARGSEKQYHTEDSELFKRIASYFTERMEESNKVSIDALADLLKGDIDEYPKVKATAQKENDRGAQRICVWGEKVTRMLSSLVERYKEEGEATLANTNVWVCTVCGFVYIGKDAPELCPICKVPSWKFEMIEGRK